MGAAELGRFEVVKLLLKRGADINPRDRSGMTALTLSQEKGHKEIVKLLKAHGARK